MESWLIFVLMFDFPSFLLRHQRNCQHPWVNDGVKSNTKTILIVFDPFLVPLGDGLQEYTNSFSRILATHKYTIPGNVDLFLAKFDGPVPHPVNLRNPVTTCMLRQTNETRSSPARKGIMMLSISETPDHVYIPRWVALRCSSLQGHRWHRPLVLVEWGYPFQLEKCRIGSWVKHSRSLRVYPMNPEPSLLDGSSLVSESKRQTPDILQKYEASIPRHEILTGAWGHPHTFPLFSQTQIWWEELGWRWISWLSPVSCHETLRAMRASYLASIQSCRRVFVLPIFSRRLDYTILQKARLYVDCELDLLESCWEL